MSDWETHSARMDQVIDDRLSDSVQYSTDGGQTYTAIDAFVLPFTEGLGLGPIDEQLGSRWRLKVAKAIVPTPLRTHRLMHPKLGAGEWRPSAGNPEDQGRYWMCDIQEA